MKRALSLFVPVLALIGILAQAPSASAVQLCPAQVNITRCGCGPIIYPMFPVHPIGPVHPIPAIACVIS